MHCKDCDVWVNSDTQMKQHLGSLRHKNTIAGIPVPPRPDKVEPAKPRSNHQYKCELCNVTLNSEVQLLQHLRSQRHKATLEGKPPKPRWVPYERFREQQRLQAKLVIKTPINIDSWPVHCFRKYRPPLMPMRRINPSLYRKWRRWLSCPSCKVYRQGCSLCSWCDRLLVWNNNLKVQTQKTTLFDVYIFKYFLRRYITIPILVACSLRNSWFGIIACFATQSLLGNMWHWPLRPQPITFYTQAHCIFTTCRTCDCTTLKPFSFNLTRINLSMPP